jgi:hypothetical protein
MHAHYRCHGIIFTLILAMTVAMTACGPASTPAPAATSAAAPASTTAPAAPTTAPAAPTTAPAPTNPPAAATPTAIATIAPTSAPLVAPTIADTLIPTSTANPNGSPLSLRHPTLPKPIAVGDANVDYRPVIGANESTFVRLTIYAAPELSSLKVEPITKKSADDPGFLYVVGPRLDLYPWMWAELQFAPDRFQVSQPNHQRKPIIAGHPAEWVWSLTPTAQARDRQDLVIHVGAVVLQTDDSGEVEVETSEGIRVSITVEELARTPELHPPAATTSSNRGDTVATVVIVFVIIAGIIATIIVTLVRQEWSERRHKPNLKR